MIKLSNKTNLYDYNEINNINDYIFFDFHKDIKYSKKILKRILKYKDNYTNIVIKNYSNEIIDILKAIYLNEDKRYEFIYDNICNRLDNKWDKYNPCKFCNNQCISAINNYMDQKYNGCCYEFKRKRFGKVDKKPCRYLSENKKCKTSNISCKLFTCNYLKKYTNFQTNYDDYLLLNIFFNKKQKLIIKYNFFKTREEILNKLNEKSNKPYFLYLLCLDFMIK